MLRKTFNNKPTFQSYIGSNGGLSGTSSITDRSTPGGRLPLEPNLIPGEVPVAQTQQAFKLTPYSEKKQGVVGALYVTNFKVHFLPYEDDTGQDGGQDLHNQRNKLVGEEDVVLNSVDVAYSVSGGRRRKLTPSSGLSSHVKTLELHCKDFRIHRFSFKITPKEECKKVVTAIVHHAFPTRLELLFAFECKGKPAPDEPASRVPKFDRAEDWEKELERLKVRGFRTVTCNAEFRQCPSLPEAVVVPSSLTNAFIASIAPQFVEYRWPVWSYTYKSGGSIVRLSYLVPETMQKDLEDKMLNAIKMAHPKQEAAKMYDLSKLLPSTKDIQNSFEKVKDLCMPVSPKETWSNDGSWYSNLDSTKWLSTVAECLKVALRVTDVITGGTTVILKEHDSRDVCAVISCLTQLLLDPHYRSLEGFQGLIEKEWVALGHPFTDRLGLIAGTDGHECPTFLLFLDCVYQLSQQFPSGFQFSETYLTSVWDAVCLGLFDSFVFNSARQRVHSAKRFSVYHNTAPPQILNAWDWSIQFNKEERSLFYNPLYLACKELDLDLTDLNKLASAAGNLGPGCNRKMILRRIYTRMLTETWEAVPEAKSDILRPVVTAPLLKFWSHCFLRWVTPLMMIGGGSPAEYLQQCVLVEEIVCLKHQLKSLKTATPFIKAARPKSDLIFSHASVVGSPSRRKWRDGLTSSFPWRPTSHPSHLGGSMLQAAPISHFIAKNSVIVDSEEEEEDDEDDEEDEMESSVDLDSTDRDLAEPPGGGGANGHHPGGAGGGALSEASGFKSESEAAALSSSGGDLDSGVNNLGSQFEEFELEELEGEGGEGEGGLHGNPQGDLQGLQDMAVASSSHTGL